MLIDTLPPGVTYNPIESLIPLKIDEAYDPRAHTYTWTIGTITPQDANCVSLTVTVNEGAEPGGELINVAELFSSNQLIARAIERTPVCCWVQHSNIIFVDQNARGRNSGVSWDHAYTDLQGALARASLGACGEAEIWVAAGTYVPGGQADDRFIIPDGIEIYGGFAGDETVRNQRNWKIYETILSGDLRDPNISEIVVVPGDNSIVDGFTIENGERGLRTTDDAIVFSLHNCIVTRNSDTGVFITNADTVIRRCVVSENGLEGIRFQNSSSGHSLEIENCRILGNQQDGVFASTATVTIRNSLVYRNGLASRSFDPFYGVHLVNLSENSIIHNNTIVHNEMAGVRFDSGTQPDVRNCIIWDNDEDGDLSQLEGIDLFFHSCINDPNDPNSLDTVPNALGNISTDPQFVYDQAPFGFYHLNDDSPCKDLGDNIAVQIDDTDIDGENRIFNTIVDMGADEIICGDTSHICDTNFDGIINLLEFSQLNKAWLSHDPNDPAVIADPNLYDPNDLARWNWRFDKNNDDDIDFDDLTLFTPDWLWQACWREGFSEMLLMGRGAEGLMQQFVAGALPLNTLPSPDTTSADAQLRQLETLLVTLYRFDRKIDLTLTGQPPFGQQEWIEIKRSLFDLSVKLQIRYLELSGSED